MSVVGFDLGHQTCYIAVARQGGIETVANEYSDRSTPTVVSMAEKNRAMGASAKQQMVSNVKNTVWGWKSMIGRKFSDPRVQAMKATAPFEIVEGPNGAASVKVSYMGQQEVFSAEQVTAMMLGKLRDTAGIGLKSKVVDCVLSVPCYFTDTERRCMLEATEMAGLNCLKLMNDTTATALAYGIYKQDLPAPEEKPRNVVFVDLGHNDLQISVCAFNKGKLKVLATAADCELGGRHFDLLLAEHFSEEFKKRYKVDAKKKPRAWVRLLQECEKLKKLMSANSTEIPMNIECFMDDKDVSGRMKRADLEVLAQGLLQRIETTMRASLDFAKLKIDDIYSVELVGGSTRIPAVKELVKAVYNKEPSTTLNADEAVARGCALQCAILSPTFRVRDFSITDCQPYPITLSWQGAMDEESDMEVFTRFHAVPFSKMLTFYRTEPFVLDARYSVPQDIPYQCPTIGSFKVQNVVPQATGESTKVKVKVRVNINGIFRVSTASMMEKVEVTEEEEKKEEEKKSKEEPKAKEEAMEVENGPVDANSEEEKKASTPPEEKEEADKSVNGDDKEMQTEESEDKNSKDKDSKEKDKDTGKKKQKMKTIDLPIEAMVPGLSREALNALVEMEGKMAANDRQEKDRADAKNNVEEYVYDMRDKLYGQLEKFVKEKDKESFLAKLDKMENWLYEEGEDEQKGVYVKKLEELKKLGDPIVKRQREWYERPRAVEEIGLALQRVRKALEMYQNQDEQYVHIDAAEMEKVSKCLKEKGEWFEKKMNALNQLQPHDDPAVFASQILQEKKLLESTCNPILNTPKPKPKEEPPKDEEKDKEKESGKGEGNANSETNTDAEQTDQSKPAEQTQSEDATKAAPDCDMELD